MAEAIKTDNLNGQDMAKAGAGWFGLLAGVVSLIMWSRFFLYLRDYLSMKIPATRRYRQLSHDHLVCRFCGHTIELLGAWRCDCGVNRPGNYYGRCPNCLKHPNHIDCPSCSFTMDVR